MRFAGLCGPRVLGDIDRGLALVSAALGGSPDHTVRGDGLVIAASGSLTIVTEPSLRVLFGVAEAEQALRVAGEDVEAVASAFRDAPAGFAFLAWEPDRPRGLLATDPLGVQSTFVAARPDCLAFASDLHELLRLLPTRPTPDPAAIVQWLVRVELDDSLTLYTGLRRLRGGHAMSLTAATRIEERRYWHPAYEPPAGGSREELGRELLAVTERAVARRLEGGAANCGVLLSGGLDSSTVAALAPREAGGLVAYTNVFPLYPELDESTFVDDLARHAGIRSVHIPAGGGSQFAPTLEFLRRFELPPVSPNLFLNLPLMRRATTDGVGVLLDGEGGDELFGRPRYLLADRVRRFRLRSARELVGGMHQIADRPELHRAAFRLWGVRGALPYWAHRLARTARPAERYAPAWLTPEGAALLAASNDPWAWKRTRGPRWWAHQLDLLTGSRERMGVHDELRRRAELAGVRSAHPLLQDLELIEAALRIPPELLFDPTHDRPVLRAALEGVIPESIRLRRDKQHFTRIYVERLAGGDRPAVQRLLGGDAPEVTRYVRADALRELLGAPPDERVEKWAGPFWRLLAVECWLRLQSDPALAGELLEEVDADVV